MNMFLFPTFEYFNTKIRVILIVFFLFETWKVVILMYPHFEFLTTNGDNMDFFKIPPSASF